LLRIQALGAQVQALGAQVQALRGWVVFGGGVSRLLEIEAARF
jgi:hypothetical protein